MCVTKMDGTTIRSDVSKEREPHSRSSSSWIVIFSSSPISSNILPAGYIIWCVPINQYWTNLPLYVQNIRFLFFLLLLYSSSFSHILFYMYTKKITLLTQFFFFLPRGFSSATHFRFFFALASSESHAESFSPVCGTLAKLPRNKGPCSADKTI